MTKYEYLFKGQNRELKESSIISIDKKRYVVMGFEDEGLYLFLNMVEEDKYLTNIESNDIKAKYIKEIQGYQLVGEKDKKEFNAWILKLRLSNKIEKVYTREELKRKTNDIKIGYCLDIIDDGYIALYFILLFLLFCVFCLLNIPLVVKIIIFLFCILLGLSPCILPFCKE